MSYTNDELRGKSALTYFNNEAARYPQNYGYDVNTLADELQSQSNGQFLDGFGFAIGSSGATDSQVKKAMEWLADSGQGQLPQHWNAFFSALKDQTTRPSFGSAVVATVEGTAGQIVSGAADVGNAVIKTGSMLTSIGPFLIVSAIIFIGYSKTMRFAGK